MVGKPTDVSACWRFTRRGSLTQDMMTPCTLSAALQRRTCQESIWRKGLKDENLPSPPSQGKNILLTFPFIEPAYVKAALNTASAFLASIKSAAEAVTMRAACLDFVTLLLKPLSL